MVELPQGDAASFSLSESLASHSITKNIQLRFIVLYFYWPFRSGILKVFQKLQNIL